MVENSDLLFRLSSLEAENAELRLQFYQAAAKDAQPKDDDNVSVASAPSTVGNDPISSSQWFLHILNLY